MFTCIKYYYCFMIQTKISLSIVFMKILYMALAHVVRKHSNTSLHKNSDITHEHLTKEVI